MSILASPISKFRFGQLDRVNIAGTAYVPVSTTDAGHLFERANDNLQMAFSHDEIAAHLRVGTLTHDKNFYDQKRVLARLNSETSALSDLDEFGRLEVLRRLRAVEWWQQEEKKDPFLKRTDKGFASRVSELNAALDMKELEIARAAGGNKRIRRHKAVPPRNAISGRTLRRYLNLYEKSGYNLLSLVPKYHKCGRKERRYDAGHYEIIRKHVVSYASRERPTVATCFRIYQSEMECVNSIRRYEGHPEWGGPSLRTFSKMVDGLNRFDVHAKRFSIDAARKKFHPVGQGPEAIRPLQRVEMDEWRVHLKTYLVWSGLFERLSPLQQGKVEASRAWLSVAIDCATRCILAMRLVQNPSASSAISTLAMVVTDKTQIAESHGARSAWGMFGTPEQLFCDNGSAYANDEFKSVVADLGVSMNLVPAGLPLLRGTVERVFRTMDTQLMSFFPGRTFGNVVEAEGYNSDALASLDTEELCTALVRWVVDVYHRQPHEGLGGATPYDTWYDLVKKYGVSPPPDPHRFCAIFGTSVRRAVTRCGIAIMGVDYQSDILQAYFRTSGQRTVEVKINPTDISFASVRLNDAWHRLTPTCDGLAGVSVDDYLRASRYARAQTKQQSDLSRSVVLAAIRDLQALGQMAGSRRDIAATVVTTEEVERAEREITMGLVVSDNGSFAPRSSTDLLVERFETPARERDNGFSSDIKFGFED